MSTEGQVIRCKAAVAWKPQQPLVIEEVEVAPPKKGEVRIKIMATGVCRTDASSLNGIGPSGITATFPVILGHEGAGVVESVGPGVTTVQAGDHVIPLYVPECGECRTCRSPKTNMCEKTEFVFTKGVLFEGTSRFTCRGKTINHYMGCSTFSQYTVVAEVCVAKIPDNVPLDKVCLLGCGVSTGYGAAINTAQVEEGSTCAIWGLGGIGLAVAAGCKAQKAARIIGIDTNEAKFHMARELFGLTEFINPNKVEKPIAELLKEMTDGGCDYTFECIGNVKTMRAAFESVHPNLGVAVVIGVAGNDQEVSVQPINFLTGRRWTGSLFGGWKSRSSMARLVNDYQEKTLPVDEFVTFTKPFDEINEGFDLMRYGKSIRTVVKLF